MTIRTQTLGRCALIAAVFALVLALVVPASATVPFQTLTTQFNGDLGQFDVVANVYQNLVGSYYVYTYEYNLTFAVGNPWNDNSEWFSVGNPSASSYFNVTNSGTYQNYPNGSLDPIDWRLGLITPGQTIRFSYDSYYQPFPNTLPVNAFAADGGKDAYGKTIGMSANVPEPGSLLALAVGLVGMFARRRR